MQVDAASLTVSKLRSLVREHLGCSLCELYAGHFSPCCRSYSSADAGKSGYRLSNGSPNPQPRNPDGSINYARYAYACKWDAIVSTVLHTFEELSKENPYILLTTENPTAHFRSHPSVVRLFSDQDSQRSGSASGLVCIMHRAISSHTRLTLSTRVSC